MMMILMTLVLRIERPGQIVPAGAARAMAPLQGPTQTMVEEMIAKRFLGMNTTV